MLGTPKTSPKKVRVGIILFYSLCIVAILVAIVSLYEILIKGNFSGNSFSWFYTLVTIFSILGIIFCMQLTWSHGLKYCWLGLQVADYSRKNEYEKAESLVEEKFSSAKNIQRVIAFSLKKPYIIRVNWRIYEQMWYYHLKMFIETERKDYFKALEYVNKIIEIAPKDVKFWVPWYNKACLHYLLEDPSSALESLNSLKKLITSNPKLSKKIFKFAKKDEDLKLLHSQITTYLSS
jgi:tetratricopeptide (TPR) repeat protein